MPRMRMRTAVRAGLRPGQPYLPVRIRKEDKGSDYPERPRAKVCGECFGPRRASTKALFCEQCMNRMFDGGYYGYQTFIRSERARRSARERRNRECLNLSASP